MPATPFQVEAWTEYAIGTLIILARIAVRCSIVGWDWEGDDYFAVIAIFFWTGELCMLELIGQYGSITGINDEIALGLTPEETRRIVIGSKCLFAGWILYVTMIWCLKSCMLFLFRRLTLDLRQMRLVNITSGICVAGYVSTVIVMLTKCLPIHKNWQVYPYPGDACALNIPNYLALVVTNDRSDDIDHPTPTALESANAADAENTLCTLVVHGHFYHYCDTLAMHSLLKRCVVHQPRNHMVYPRDIRRHNRRKRTDPRPLDDKEGFRDFISWLKE